MSERIEISTMSLGARRAAMVVLGLLFATSAAAAVSCVAIAGLEASQPRTPFVVLALVFGSLAAACVWSFTARVRRPGVLDGTVLTRPGALRSRQVDLARVEDARVEHIDNGGGVRVRLRLVQDGRRSAVPLTVGATTQHYLPADQLTALEQALSRNPRSAVRDAATALRRLRAEHPSGRHPSTPAPTRPWLPALLVAAAGVVLAVVCLVIVHQRWARSDSFFQADGDAVSYGVPSCPAGSGAGCTVTVRVHVEDPGPDETVPAQFRLPDRAALPTRPTTVTVWVSEDDRSVAYSGSAPAPGGRLSTAVLGGLAVLGLGFALTGLGTAAYAWRDRRVAPGRRLRLDRSVLPAVGALIVIAAFAAWRFYDAVHLTRVAVLRL